MASVHCHLSCTMLDRFLVSFEKFFFFLFLGYCPGKCQNGGKCTFNEEDQLFRCECPENYIGNKCEKCKFIFSQVYLFFLGPTKLRFTQCVCNPQFSSTVLVTCTEEICKEKIHFLCSGYSFVQ